MLTMHAYMYMYTLTQPARWRVRLHDYPSVIPRIYQKRHVHLTDKCGFFVGMHQLKLDPMLHSVSRGLHSDTYAIVSILHAR